MKKQTKVLTLSIFLILGFSMVAAQDQSVDQIQNTGPFTPDSAFYGLETAWDSVAMTTGISNAEEVANKRAAEAQAMADEGNYEAVERAAQGLGNVAERAENPEELERATNTLNEVMEQAPEEAQEGLQTAMDNVQERGPQGPETEPPTPGPDGEITDGQPEDQTGQEVGPDGDPLPESDTDDPQPEPTQPNGGTDETQPDGEPTDADDQEDGVEQIVIEGESFEFNPETVQVEAGQEVEFVFANQGGTHDLVIEEVDTGTEVISTGERDSFTHTFEEEGEYEFICSVGNHAEEGMTGTIEVEE